MGYVGVSLIVASVVYVAIRPPAWVSALLWRWTGFGGAIGDVAAKRQLPPPAGKEPQDQQSAPQDKTRTSTLDGPAEPKPSIATKSDLPAHIVSPPTLQPPTIQPPTIQPPTIQPPTIQPPTIQPPSITEPDDTAEEQTTPKAKTASLPPVPAFTLSDDAPTSKPAANFAMPPPPIPVRSPAQQQPNRLAQFPAANSIQRARGPVPNRGPPSSSSSSSLGLAPPPSHSAPPSKPSRKVLLTPGHSPLDWARISGPNADLRGVPPSTPYLRVPPSLLKKHNGRKGNDAWMALNGKVYNVTPYAQFHPGGVPELMRGAGKDGTKIYGEVHPWVNYETMLAACLVGILVEEPEAHTSEMDQMD